MHVNDLDMDVVGMISRFVDETKILRGIECVENSLRLQGDIVGEIDSEMADEI